MASSRKTDTLSLILMRLLFTDIVHKSSALSVPSYEATISTFRDTAKMFCYSCIPNSDIEDMSGVFLF
jgi:hypothetical protein